MKNKRKISFFIIIVAVLMVCSVSVFAASADVKPSSLQIEISWNGNRSDTVSLRDTSFDEFYAFAGVDYVKGNTYFDIFYNFSSIPSNSDGVFTIFGKFGYQATDLLYVGGLRIDGVTVEYADGSSLFYSPDSFTYRIDHTSDGTVWYLQYFIENFEVVKANQITSMLVHSVLLDVGHGSITPFFRIVAKLSNFGLSYELPTQPGDEVFNDFSGFGNDAGAVEDSENQIKDEISNYHPHVTSLLSDFSSIVGDLTAPLRAVTLLVNDFVSGIPFLNLMLRFALSVGIVAFLLGTGSFIISKISSGVSAAHRDSDRAKAASRNAKG